MDNDAINILLQKLNQTKEKILLIIEESEFSKELVEEIERIFFEDFGI